MGLFDQMMGGVLNNVLGQAARSGGLDGLLNAGLNGAFGQALPNMLNTALANSPFGSLDGILDQLRAHGLDTQVASWLSGGENLPVSAEQVVAALGDAPLAQLASSLGLSADSLPGLLAQYLPTLVHRLSPGGVLQTP